MKRIAKHPGVEWVEPGENSGVDYKWEVKLKPGWMFAHGRMAGCVFGHFNTYDEFVYADPKQDI